MQDLSKKEQLDITERLATSDVVDILEDPTSFGMPTFKQFCANPDKWRRPADEILRSVDLGSTTLKSLRKHAYYFEAYPCKSLEEVERIAAAEGVLAEQLQLKVGLETLGDGYKAHCHFYRPGWTGLITGGLHETIDGPAN